MHQIGVSDYNQLHHWSINNLDKFWSHAWDICGIEGSKGSSAYLAGESFTDSLFFPTATLNVAENLIENNLTSEIAITLIQENGEFDPGSG